MQKNMQKRRSDREERGHVGYDFDADAKDNGRKFILKLRRLSPMGTLGLDLSVQRKNTPTQTVYDMLHELKVTYLKMILFLKNKPKSKMAMRFYFFR
jgi:hypothetical protein